MKLEEIEIKNFRNFKDAHIKLENKNLLFGRNDVGKTNFLFALMFLFNPKFRSHEMADTDFHERNTNAKIEITIKLKLEDDSEEVNDYTDILRSRLNGILSSGVYELYIKFEGNYEPMNDSYSCRMLWGEDKSDLKEIPTQGTKYIIDEIFDIVYINSYASLDFYKEAKALMDSETDEDVKHKEEIKRLKSTINEHIQELSGVKQLSNELSSRFEKLGDSITNIKLLSNINYKNEFSYIQPYICENEDKIYPTGGDGRKKILAYAMKSVKNSRQIRNKIRIYLFEEPENHLHKSLQIKLSKLLFSSEEDYPYLFITSHSPYLLGEMNNINLVRIYQRAVVETKNYFYRVPKKYEEYRKCLNYKLAEALFSEHVLLVEGPSEEILFSKIIQTIYPYYEVRGYYILPVNGISFQIYYDIISALGITLVVKTDNDLRSSRKGYIPIGAKRCNTLVNIIDKESKHILPEACLNISELPECDVSGADPLLVSYKRDWYDKHQLIIDSINDDYNIFISRVDLENDLYENLSSTLDKYFSDTDEVVKYLHESKMFHMAELVSKLTDEDCFAIYEDSNFKCLKAFCHGMDTGTSCSN